MDEKQIRVEVCTKDNEIYITVTNKDQVIREMLPMNSRKTFDRIF